MNELKRCAKCSEDIERKYFSKNSRAKDGLYSYCKPCNRLVKGRIYPKKDMVYASVSEEVQAIRKGNIYYKNRYGITFDEYNQMFTNQQGKCKICGRHQNELKRKLAVDHCHSTGNIRGLLCSPCNIGIGCLKESESIMEAAIIYLRHSV
jgi:hypothetical protein